MIPFDLIDSFEVEEPDFGTRVPSRFVRMIDDVTAPRSGFARGSDGYLLRALT